ncbi:MAG: CDP-alcohol phosphatidyltransferase family protein, partial [Kiritimatiellae bacterium]|nr:CDP-alcohol phosphatidyltransferase family protein [Kiritimatiellia bacterium]
MNRTHDENGDALPKAASKPGDALLKAASKPGEPALVTALFARRLAQPLAEAAVRRGVSADSVTVAGGLCWVASLPLAPIAGICISTGARAAGFALWFLCGCLWNAGYILDVADGSVARMTGTSSRAGFFLDSVFHFLFKPAFLFSVGLGLAFSCDIGTGLGPWPVRLFVLAAIVSLPANGAAAPSAAECALCDA